MNWNLPPDERSHLRQLAARQAEIAALPIMDRRKGMWYALNDAQAGACPPVVIETWTFDRDFLPESAFQCQSSSGRAIETQLLRNIRNYELINDDKVTPDTFDIGWFIEEDEFGVTIPRESVPDADGVVTGFRYLHPIQDLERDLPGLKPATFRVDRARTLAWKDFLTDLLGDLLPVEIRAGGHVSTMLTNRVIELMGMQAFFLALYDQPQAVHALMSYLRDNALRRMHWMESEGLLRLNNANQDSFGSSYNFTRRLPQASEVPHPQVQLSDFPQHSLAPYGLSRTRAGVRLGQVWGCSNSQETVGISPRMFHEFCFPYYREVVEPFGLLYYGCCEPVHPFWQDISQLPHLKKVSISRWCDQNFMGEALRGTEIVFSRKPDPNFLSLDTQLNEDAWAAHICETLDATCGVFTEFIIRDVYTLHGNIHNARRAVEIARGEIQRHYRS